MQTALQRTELAWPDPRLATADAPSTPALKLLPKPVMPSGSAWYESGKRAFDISAAALMLLLLTPLLLLVAILIRLESSDPIFFSQTRCGRAGRHFRFWKFRSMVVDAEARKHELRPHDDLEGGIRFKMSCDPRVTRVGRLIRKYSIDELPQLWNVIVGDMALVGPRPPLPDEHAQYSSYENQRLAVTPGITCTWQVSGRSEIPFEQQVELDLDYIRRRSFALDLSILLSTPLAVLAARGAY